MKHKFNMDVIMSLLRLKKIGNPRTGTRALLQLLSSHSASYCARQIFASSLHEPKIPTSCRQFCCAIGLTESSLTILIQQF